MIVALGLLAALVVIGFGAPRYLSVTVAPGLAPRLALTAWIATIALALSAMIAAPLSMFTWPGRTAFGAAHACIRQLRESGSLPWIDTAQVLLAAAGVGTVVHVGFAVLRSIRNRRAAARDHLRAVRLLAESTTVHRGVEVLWIGGADPVCYSVGAGGGSALSTTGPHRPTIVASGDIAALPRRERLAVLDHEVGHLRGRHHLLLAVAEALASALPFVPLFRQAPDAVRTLVEFAADHHAATRSGTRTVGSALLTVHAHTASAAGSARPSGAAAPAAALGLSDEAVAARLSWLRTPPTRRQRLCDRAQLPVAAFVALVPLALSVATMLAAAALVCLQLQS